MDIMKQITEQGRQIESDSVAQIDREIVSHHGDHNFTPAQWNVVCWASHSSGDFEFTKLFRFSDHATERGIEALKNGANIVTNVNMMWPA